MREFPFKRADFFLSLSQKKKQIEKENTIFVFRLKTKSALIIDQIKKL